MNKNNLPDENKKQNEHIPTVKRVAVLLLALIGGFVLWVYAIGYDSTEFERRFDGVQVVIEGEDTLAVKKGYRLGENQNFPPITVTAKGKRSVLNELDASDFRAVIDVSQSTKAGNQEMKVVVYSPNGVNATPSSETMEVYVDKFTQRNVLLTVEVITGDNYIMSDGVTFVDTVANPLTVVVSGPEAVLDSIGGAYVKFNLDGHIVNENITGTGEIELRNKSGEIIKDPYVKISEKIAHVSINVTKQKVVPVRVKFIGGVFNPADVSIELSTSFITISGTPDMVDSFDEVIVKIDETTINGNATFDNISVGSLLPDGISNESGVSMLSVTVTLPKMAVRTYKIKPEKISVINLDDGMIPEIEDGFEVTLIGPREAFNDFDKELLSATLDFNNVTIEPDGSYTAKANISLGAEYSGIYIQSVDYKVNFTIK